MTKEWPKFEVCVVTEQGRKGLLISKQRSKDDPVETWYFTYPDGLPVTPEIRDVCKGRDAKLEPSYVIERRLCLELLSYAERAHSAGANLVFDISQDYSYGTAFQKNVNSYFDAKSYSPLRDFLESPNTLRSRILTNPRGEHRKLIGFAKFSVKDASKLASPDYRYLIPADQVLDSNRTKSAMWFRPLGPIAADFDAKIVYCPENKLNEIKSKLSSDHHCCLLEGGPATGKTVLVRYLAYDLMKNQSRVYFFDCLVEGHLPAIDIAEEINRGKGVFVIENIHPFMRETESLLHRLKTDTHRQVLLTTRPQHKQFTSVWGSPIDSVPTVFIEPFENVYEIMRHFASDHANVTWLPVVFDNIVMKSKNDLLFVACALQGIINDPSGDANTWILKGAEIRLEDLRRENPRYPEILILLSALFRHEVFMEEKFLRKNLPVDINILSTLCRRGEVIRVKRNGYISYGLPHSSWGELFWTIGQPYWELLDLGDVEDFIYSYITSNIHNPFGISCQIESLTTTLLARMRMDGLLLDIARHEHSARSTLDVLYLLYCMKDHQNDELMQLATITVSKIKDCEDLRAATVYLHYTLAVPNLKSRLELLLPAADLAQMINRSTNLSDIYFCIISSPLIGIEYLSKLRSTCDTKIIAQNCRIANDSMTIYAFLLEMAGVSKEWALEIWNTLGATWVAEKVCDEVVGERGFNLIHLFSSVSPQFGKELWAAVDKNVVRKWLHGIDILVFGAVLCHLSPSNPTVVSSLIKLLPPDKLNRLVDEMSSIRREDFPEPREERNPEIIRMLAEHVDCTEAVGECWHCEDLDTFLKVLDTCVPEAAQSIRKRLNRA